MMRFVAGSAEPAHIKRLGIIIVVSLDNFERSRLTAHFAGLAFQITASDGASNKH
jgi:hypothetical protein